jgi:hypothetical protein
MLSGVSRISLPMVSFRFLCMSPFIQLTTDRREQNPDCQVGSPCPTDKTGKVERHASTAECYRCFAQYDTFRYVEH